MKTIYIIMFVFINGIGNLYSYEPMMRTMGFAPHHVYGKWIDTIFIIKDISTVNQINHIIDTSSDFHNSTETNLFAICFEKLNENQIDSAINLFNDNRSIVEIIFMECPIKKLPNTIKLLGSLYKIQFEKCDSISSMNGYNSMFTIFSLNFIDCRIKKLPEGVENLFPMLSLILRFPNDFTDFNINNELLKFEQRKNIIDLYIRYYLLDEFPRSLFNLTALQTLVFYSNNINDYPPEFDKLVNLRQIHISCYDDRVKESASKISTLNYFHRLKKGMLNSYDFLNTDLIDCRFNKSRLIDIEYRMFYNKRDAKDLTLELGNQHILIQPNTDEGIIQMNFPDLKNNDKLKVTFLDDRDKFLFSIEEKNKIAVIDLNKYKGGTYYVNVKINNLSLKIEIEIPYDWNK